MRRPASSPPGLFRGNELRRLISAVLFLGVVGLFYNHFRRTQIADKAKEAETPAATAIEWHETVVPIPDSDGAQDSIEKDAFREEAEALVDKKPYMAEEMASYWRLFRWARAETTEELEKRARRDVVFTHLFQDPAKFRGELIHLRLHVKQVLPQPDLGENSAGVNQVFEAHGVTDDSRTFPYIVIFPEKPPQLPIGHSVHEEATFVGFFHKLVTYEELTGTSRAAPVLIGRITWMEDPVAKGLREQGDTTTWIFVGVFAVVALLIGAQSWYVHRQKVVFPDKPVDQKALDQWLESGEIPEPVGPGAKANGPPPWLTTDDSAEATDEGPKA